MKLEFLAKLHPALFATLKVCKVWSILALELITDNYPWYQGEWAMELRRAMMLQDMFWELQNNLYSDMSGYYYERELERGLVDDWDMQEDQQPLSLETEQDG